MQERNVGEKASQYKTLNPLPSHFPASRTCHEPSWEKVFELVVLVFLSSIEKAIIFSNIIYTGIQKV